ncbi:hypothetical protein C7999DRAFT_31289 [Corynascus novoguineensis]|uniref:Uncharacterized protein n=1 Tax=Corynascus novoguineensis TaxID=1126955 RepID=A0AAN7CTU8_9PEZI|nr:hypothetical protein C7999DRAFT_31289 [Corynascus novoguineensis]
MCRLYCALMGKAVAAEIEVETNGSSWTANEQNKKCAKVNNRNSNNYNNLHTRQPLFPSLQLLQLVGPEDSTTLDHVCAELGGRVHVLKGLVDGREMSGSIMWLWDGVERWIRWRRKLAEGQDAVAAQKEANDKGQKDDEQEGEKDNKDGK